MAGRMIAILFLSGLSIRDIKKKELSGVLLAVMLPVSVGYMIYNGEVKSGLIGMAEGVILYLVAKLTGEQIGKGDALVLAGTGMLLGAVSNMEMFMTALCLCAIWAGTALIFCRWNKQKTLPFLPFMAAAEMILTLLYVCETGSV